MNTWNVCFDGFHCNWDTDWFFLYLLPFHLMSSCFDGDTMVSLIHLLAHRMRLGCSASYDWFVKRLGRLSDGSLCPKMTDWPHAIRTQLYLSLNLVVGRVVSEGGNWSALKMQCGSVHFDYFTTINLRSIRKTIRRIRSNVSRRCFSYRFCCCCWRKWECVWVRYDAHALATTDE